MSRWPPLPKPVVAAITGYALGGGPGRPFRRLQGRGEGARLGQPIELGIIPGAGGRRRPRLVGSTRAKGLIFTGGGRSR